MTANFKTRKRKYPSIRTGTALFCLASIFLLCMLLRNSQIAIEYMKTGLRLCAFTVIPSLFPFMVLAELLVACGFGELLGAVLGKPAETFFGIPKEASSALLLGIICGFPIGAKAAISLYDRGILSKREVERVMIFCNIPSSGFLISAVGVSLYADHRFGIFLFLSTLLSSLAMGLLTRLLLPHAAPPSEDRLPSSIHIPAINVSAFTRAISSATASMLSVCACVLFFTSIGGCVAYMLRSLSTSPLLEAILFCLLEISSGVRGAASLNVSAISTALCGFAVGWSGISVHFQILALGCDRGISFAPYLLSKLCQGLLCALLAFLYGILIAPEVRASQILFSVPTPKRQLYIASVCILFLICAVHYCKRRGKY